MGHERPLFNLCKFGQLNQLPVSTRTQGGVGKSQVGLLIKVGYLRAKKRVIPLK